MGSNGALYWEKLGTESIACDRCLIDATVEEAHDLGWGTILIGTANGSRGRVLCSVCVSDLNEWFSTAEARLRQALTEPEEEEE